MWTYRDRTFCANKNCPNKQCYRRLTDEIKKLSKTYRIPVAYSYFKCEEKEDGERV